MRVALYIRVSTDQQAESGYSLPEQERALRAHCERQGLTVVEILSDDGVSGAVLDRPAMRRALELTKSGAIEALVLVKLDRLGRKNRIIQELLHQVRAHGCRILFVEHTIEDTPSGRLMLNVLGGFAEFEWDLIRERTMSGRAEKARSGRYPGGFGPKGPPYGYRLITVAEASVLPQYHGRDGELEIVESEAELVRELFRRAAEGRSQHSLCQWANETGYRTRAGRPWASSSIRSILRCEVYTGTIYYGRRRSFEREYAGMRPREEWMPISLPVIVPAEQWHASQHQLDRHARRGDGTKPADPLSGLVFCATCKNERSGAPLGCRMWTMKAQGHRYGYYACNSDHIYSRPYCGTRAAAEKVREEALTAMRAALAPGVLGRMARAKAEAARQEALREEVTPQALRRELAACDAQEHEIADLLLKGISSHIVADRLARVKEKREETLRRLSEVEKRQAHLRDPEEAQLHADTIATRMREHLASDEPEREWRLVRALIRVYLHPGRKWSIDVETEPPEAW